MQVLDNAAREAARKAAVDSILDPTTGQTTNIYTTDVINAATNYLAREGWTTTNVTVTFEDLDNSSATNPYLASHLDHLRVTVTISYADVRLGVTSPYGSLFPNLTAQVDWYNLTNNAFTVNSTIPSAN